MKKKIGISMKKCEMERSFDLILSISALFILAPIFLLVIMVLRVTGEGEIFYRQARVGRNGKDFKLLKFATMLKDSPNIGSGTITLQNDPRVLPFGRFLRHSKLNELPQLINVINGEMSLIGPRPQTRRCFLAFDAAAQADIISVRPGLSGLGSIIFRSEDEMLSDSKNGLFFYDEVIAPYKGSLETWFVNNKCLKLYFILIFLTIYCVLFPQKSIVWRFIAEVPKPPKALKKYFN